MDQDQINQWQEQHQLDQLRERQRQRMRQGEFSSYGDGNQNVMAQPNGPSFNPINGIPSMIAPGVSSGIQSTPHMAMSTFTPLPTPRPSLSPHEQGSIQPVSSMLSPNFQNFGLDGFNMHTHYNPHSTFQNMPGMLPLPQNSGFLQQFPVGPLPTPMPNIPDGPIQMPSSMAVTMPTAMPTATSDFNAMPPVPRRQPDPSPAANSNSPTPGPNNSERRVANRRSRRSRASSEQDRISELSDLSNLRWRPGMRQTRILDSWSEERKEAARIRNEFISRCKAEHTRKQNRVSARKSRKKKEDALHAAWENVASLRERVAELTEQAARNQNAAEERDRTIATLAAQNEALVARIDQLRGLSRGNDETMTTLQYPQPPVTALAPEFRAEAEAQRASSSQPGQGAFNAGFDRHDLLSSGFPPLGEGENTAEQNPGFDYHSLDGFLDDEE
ncbi:hypothetical protein Daesc_009984 [Daldinia eschscholtzii]|uniref:BZIP domain-containing protein n=1 Tax=Daldinia eschscholtzii TaxID=292717 RepID=A0AAX6M6L9_9PEZI